MLQKEFEQKLNPDQQDIRQIAYKEFLAAKKNYEKIKKTKGPEVSPNDILFARKNKEEKLAKYESVVQKRQTSKEIAEGELMKELVRWAVFLQKELNSNELADYLIDRRLTPKLSVTPVNDLNHEQKNTQDVPEASKRAERKKIEQRSNVMLPHIFNK
ncbi:MAG: hypothetical protein IC227_05805 [Enterococcus lacertideformus]|uniref:Uncharacterized protein n=1 Tax=Enterococcus lacertideformus TaxID=2771493 RepID=A0A931AW51_9ENTE|nr:hypothetical protein [Enterococcus lacertideformus]